MAFVPVKDSKFAELQKKLLFEGKLWEDPNFKADDSSLYRSPKEQPPSGLKWLRPQEINRGHPEFFAQGASRFDIKQGSLGDCWALAGAASLSRYPRLFERLVPSDQSFNDNWYAGVFRFHFWHYGEWVEVLVDDRLPTSHGKLVFVQSGRPNEFWAALLEKAYAKFYGNYEAIVGGNNADSLTDFTGGLVECFSMDNPPVNLSRLLSKATERCSVMSASIYGDYRQNPVRPNGLVAGHAYSVTGYTEVTQQGGQKVCLIRIRNPWGTETEWNGPWSDRSANWSTVPPDVAKELHSTNPNGEFWMALEDFVKQFSSLEICNLTPDDLCDSRKPWAVSQGDSQWKNPGNAGGRKAFGSSSFYKNPQFHIDMQDYDEDDDKTASFVVQVLQKNRRRQGLDYVTLGFVVYGVPPKTTLPLSRDDLRRLDPVELVAQNRPRPPPSRMIVERFDEAPGSYIIIPTAWNAGDEAEFMVRVFSEAAHTSSEVLPK